MYFLWYRCRYICGQAHGQASKVSHGDWVRKVSANCPSTTAYSQFAKLHMISRSQTTIKMYSTWDTDTLHVCDLYRKYTTASLQGQKLSIWCALLFLFSEFTGWMERTTITNFSDLMTECQAIKCVPCCCYIYTALPHMIYKPLSHIKTNIW